MLLFSDHTNIYNFYCVAIISHPNKNGVPQVDLSGDTKASVDLSCVQLSSCQLAVKRVIVKLFMHHKCNMVITDRLRSIFTMKLWRMEKLICSLGGKARSQLYTKWAQSKWTILLYENVVIQQSRNQRKRCCNENVVMVSSKKCSQLLKKN